MSDIRSNANFPGLHYFCVDVETSALRVWEGELLTIGCVVVDAAGNVVDTFYERCDVRDLHASWYDESLPPRTDTQSWWREQNTFAKNEAWADRTLKRFATPVVAHHFRNFALTYGAEWTERIFVADPDKFDWVWTDYLFSAAKVTDPFWYHALDMWSLRHGAYAQRRTGKNRGVIDISKRHTTHDAVCEHHALSDAYALAEDLLEFLGKTPDPLDAPHLEGYAEFLKES